MPAEETDHRDRRVFDGDDGDDGEQTAARIDRRIHRRPGLDGLGLIGE